MNDKYNLVCIILWDFCTNVDIIIQLLLYFGNHSLLDTNMNALCQDCGKHMPSYVKFCYDCGHKVTSRGYVDQYTDSAQKTTLGKFVDYLSITLMAGFGGILFLTVGFVMLYYTLFYLNLFT